MRHIPGSTEIATFPHDHPVCPTKHITHETVKPVMTSSPKHSVFGSNFYCIFLISESIIDKSTSIDGDQRKIHTVQHC